MRSRLPRLLTYRRRKEGRFEFSPWCATRRCDGRSWLVRPTMGLLKQGNVAIRHGDRGPCPRVSNDTANASVIRRDIGRD